MGKRKKKRKRKALDAHTIEKRGQAKEIRALMSNVGFKRVPKVDGKEFVYDGRTSEMDDIFHFENVIVFSEYTLKKEVGEHLKNKKIIYDKMNANLKEFFKFLLDHPKFTTLKSIYEDQIKPNYTINQLQLRILYASKHQISQEHRGLIEDVLFFDYHIVKYFESISKVIKKSTIYEFADFLRIDYNKLGKNIKASPNTGNEFHGHILPEEHSSFKDGYKLVTFYIDADSLLRRSFVLRRDGWRNRENIGLYQRMFLPKKIKAMRRHLHTNKRVFINNLIVTLLSDHITITDNNGVQLKIDSKGNFKNSSETKVQPAMIGIEDKSGIIGIIDGQHRLYSYHEGDDVYEKTIASFRTVQNLLVTAILFPKSEPDEKRIKFEANLFLEINANQSGASSQLKQEIELMLDPFSTTSISKAVMNKLNDSGPLEGVFEEFWFQKAKLKTSSIISFGLRQLVKFEGEDSLFKLWRHPNKADLKTKVENYSILDAYRDFCFTEIRKLFMAFKGILRENWQVDRSDKKAILTVTTVNGIINCMRLLIENNKLSGEAFYKVKLNGVESFNFKKYKSSQYRRLGEDLYIKFFAD